MNAKARLARRTVSQRRSDNRAVKMAGRAAQAPVTSAKNRLIASGIKPATADRFASVFSRGVTADGTTTTSIKLKGRIRKTVQVKLYSRDTFAGRLSVYRPQDKTAAREFAQAAHRLAA